MPELRYTFRALCVVAAIALSSFSLGSCTLAKNQLETDRAAEKDIQDYRDALAPQPQTVDDGASSTPDFQAVISTPEDLKLPSPLVTVSVNQTVSLRDLMFELADQADIDLEMDPQIRGSIIFTAKERPFNDVVERIAEMAGLRYTFANDVLRIELDRPYIKTYKVDYMNLVRTSKSSIKTSISSSTGGDGSSATNTAGSDASVDNDYSSDYWKEIDDGLKQILLASDTYLSLATLADPVATPVAPPPPPVQLDANGNPMPATTPPPIETQPPTLNIATPTADPLVPNAPSTYSISKQTGAVTVFASERQHKLVKSFLDTLRRTSMTQILIEARVMEVALSDEFVAGIDWGALNNITGMAAIGGSLTAPSMNPEATGTFTAKLNLGDLQPIVTALSRFGTVRALSSPRVTVMNNQPAVVNVAENKIYFQIDVDQTTTGDPPVIETTFSTTQKSSPEGVLMNVVPTANTDTGEIILAVRPTISKEVRSVEDPTVKLNFPDADITNMIPQLSVQEIDSIVKMQSGQTMVMGGLMREQNITSQQGVPVLGDIPMVGSLFRNHGDNIQKSELVIFLTATIVPGSNVDEMDRKLYREFGKDRRPKQL